LDAKLFAAMARTKRGGTTHLGLANTAGAFARMRQLDEKLLAEMARLAG